MKRTKCCLLLIILPILLIFYVVSDSYTTTSFAAESISEKTQQSVNKNMSTAHLIILAGQSNCEGVSSIHELKKHVPESDYQKYIEGFPNIKISHYRAGSNGDGTYWSYWTDFSPCKLGMGTSEDCFGIELGMADYLSKTFPNEEFYLIKRAHGGTPIYPFWNAPYNDQVGMYYEALLQHTDEVIDNLSSQGKRVIVESFCWMQGEEDACHDISQAKEYYKWLSQLAEHFRSRYSRYNPQTIRFVDGGISDYNNDFHEIVNYAKLLFSQKNSENYFIDTIELGITRLTEPTNSVDWIHLDSYSMFTLGTEFGKRAYNEQTYQLRNIGELDWIQQ